MARVYGNNGNFTDSYTPLISNEVNATSLGDICDFSVKDGWCTIVGSITINAILFAGEVTSVDVSIPTETVFGGSLSNKCTGIASHDVSNQFAHIKSIGGTSTFRITYNATYAANARFMFNVSFKV